MVKNEPVDNCSMPGIRMATMRSDILTIIQVFAPGDLLTHFHNTKICGESAQTSKGAFLLGIKWP